MSNYILCGCCGGLGDSFYNRGTPDEPDNILETCRVCLGRGLQTEPGLAWRTFNKSKAQKAMDAAIASINLTIPNFQKQKRSEKK